MDPLSIATGAAAIVTVLFTASKRLYSFTQSLEGTDHVIEQLRGQALGLASLFQGIASALQQPLPKRVVDENAQLWTHISFSIDGCQSTVVELLRKLDKLDTKRKTAFSTGIRQFKLGSMQGEIHRLFAAMQTHSINMQLSMSTVQVLISSSLPEIIVESFELHLEKLERQHNAVDQSLEHSSALEFTHNSQLRSIILDDNTRKLRDSASSIIYSANTAVITSASTTRTVIDPDIPIFESFDFYAMPPIGLGTPSIQMESTTGSEYGTPLNQAIQSQIQSWLDNSAPLDAIDEASSSHLSTYTGISSNEEARIAQNAQDSESEVEDESSDDEMDLQVARNLFQEAADEFHKGNYALAEKQYRNAFELEQVKSMSSKNRSNFGLKDIKLNQAICLLHQKKLGHCERILIGLTQDKTQTPSDGRRVFKALHYLATIRLQQGNLAAALTYCRQARNGRNKSFGKNDPEYISSVRLYALIRWAQGLQHEAKEYIKFLPPESRIAESDFDRVLETEFFFKKVTVRRDLRVPQTQTNDLRRIQEQPKILNSVTRNTEMPYRPIEPHAPLNISPRLPQIDRKPVQENRGQLPSVTIPYDKELTVPYRRNSAANTIDSIDYRINSPSDFGNLDFDQKSFEAASNTSDSSRARKNSEETLHSSGRPTIDPRGSSLSGTNSRSPTLFDAPAPNFIPKQPDLGVNNIYTLEFPDFDKFYIDPQTLKSTSVEMQQAEHVLKKAGYKGKKINQGLCWAAREGNVHAVNCVLAKPDIDPELRVTRFLMERQDTALHLAVRRNHLRVAAILLPRYSSPDILDAIGATPLRIAASEGYWQMCVLLLRHGASVNGVRADWGKPLRSAAFNGRLDTCALLLAKGADINAQGGNLRQTALMAAALAGHFDICKFLCSKGAHRGLVDTEGRDAALVARKGGHSLVFNWLSSWPKSGN